MDAAMSVSRDSAMLPMAMLPGALWIKVRLNQTDAAMSAEEKIAQIDFNTGKMDLQLKSDAGAGPRLTCGHGWSLSDGGKMTLHPLRRGI
jgi:hypothetical protein